MDKPIELRAILISDSRQAHTESSDEPEPVFSPRPRQSPTEFATSLVDDDDDLDLDPDEAESIALPVPKPARLRFGRSRRRSGMGRRSGFSKRKGTWDEARIDRSTEISEFKVELGSEYEDVPTEVEFRFLTQFFAMCVGVLGLVLIVPSLMAWGGWTALPVQPLGSRWVFIMVFLGGLHLVYAIFLFQIQDRAGLWSVAVFLLMVSCLQGVFTAGTWLDHGAGPVSRFLQLPVDETATVTLWCFLHLCFAILLGYLCGRQAMRWGRIERPPANPA
jgi:hypothetical protein